MKGFKERTFRRLPAALALLISLSLADGLAAHTGQDAGTPAGAAEAGAEAVMDRMVHAIDPCSPGQDGQPPAEQAESLEHQNSAQNEAGKQRVSNVTATSCDPADLADF